MKTFLIQGVPMAIQQDGWWLNDGGSTEKPEPGIDTKGQGPIWRLGVLVALIALGDILVWQVNAGISLAVFGALTVAAAIGVSAGKLGRRRMATVAGGAFLALLPLVELVQPLSVVIACGGLSVVLALLAGIGPSGMGRAVLRLWPLGLYQTVCDAGQVMTIPDRAGFPGNLNRMVMHWFVPAALGLIFVLLMLLANPVADQWVRELTRIEVALPGWGRGLFWVVLIPLIWTALNLNTLRERLGADPRPLKAGPGKAGIINSASTTRALFLFNGVFAVQTVMDVMYLYGGVGLPDGITYAQYAHRGAYPLLVTALLAGGFALLTRRWTDGNPMLRALMMVWIAQNVALVISSLVRLGLYVEVYGLTHLRIAAAIWMVLVACGLVLVLWQVWRGRENRWMLVRAGALGIVTLYVSTFISFDAVIARYNLAQTSEVDLFYICHLGDAAQPVILEHELTLGRPVCYSRHAVADPHDWREWGFRNWRARNSLTALQAEGAL